MARGWHGNKSGHRMAALKGKSKIGRMERVLKGMAKLKTKRTKQKQANMLRSGSVHGALKYRKRIGKALGGPDRIRSSISFWGKMGLEDSYKYPDRFNEKYRRRKRRK